MNKSDRKKLQTGLYIGLAIVLVLCLFSMPYGFYHLVRFAAVAIFAYLEGLVDGLVENSEELEKTLEGLFNSEEL